MKAGNWIRRVGTVIRNGLSTRPRASAGDALPLPRRLIAWSCVGGAVGLVLLALWASLAPLSGAVVAEGVVRTEGERKTVKHQEGGIVKAIRVMDGDRVKAGQVLVVLDNVSPAAELAALRAQRDAEQARIARLSAERDLKDRLVFPADLTGRRHDPHVAELLQRESTLFATRRRTFQDQMSMLRAELAHARQEIAVSAQLVQTMGGSHAMAVRQRETNETLNREGFVADMKVLDTRRVEADALTDKEARSHFYVVRVEVLADADAVALGPGLRAEVYIRKQARSALDHLLEPIVDGMRRSMRD